MNIKFISYDGDYPTLCSGRLTLEIDGTEYVFSKHFLESNGDVQFDENWSETILIGDWSINEFMLPEWLKPYKDTIEKIVNENVPYGCCGGCL